MPRAWALFFALPLFASTIPDRYIVQLSTEPIAVHMARNAPRRSAAAALRTADAQSHRAAIRVEQARARAAIEQAGGRIRGALEILSNALLVEIPEAQSGELPRAPGAKAVYPVRRFAMTLDHALPLHHVPHVWAQIGYANAGAGVKIGIIDTGIEITHPGFNDAGFTAPPGFPLVDGVSDLGYTNNKVIVARSYASRFEQQDPDASVSDHVGHGTATAMIAAGVMNSGVLTTITGVAPQAYIGVYKVFGTPGINDSASEEAILSAMEDAVNDGMNVINLSLGFGVPSLPQSDPFVQAVEAASGLGVLVVASAGNNGPNPGTVGTPAVAPHAIATGASNNDRMFAGTVQIAGGPAFTALPGSGLNSFTPVSGAMVDVATLDPSGLACNPLPAKALNRAIALIERGTCTFETKLDNAQAAGATAAIVYDNIVSEPLPLMGVGGASLPAAMVSNADGLRLKQQIASTSAATVQFYSPIYADPASMAVFSATGPTPQGSIKPDLTAVGENFYTATETLDPAGELYNPTGYTISQGTSFSAPLIAGAAALLESARPGLTVDQYRSLLIDTADLAYATPGNAARVQQAGGGFLDALSALSATAAVSPVSVSFGTSAGEVNSTVLLTISNAGAAADTFQLSATARDPGAPVPQFPATNARIDAGASISIPLLFSASGLAPGQYEGFIEIQGSQTTVPTQVPYWFAVPSATPAFVTVLASAPSGAAGGVLDGGAIFRVTDASGLPVSITPSATVVSGGGAITGMLALGAAYPNDYALSVRLGTQPGPNVFQIQAGPVSVALTITGQ